MAAVMGNGIGIVVVGSFNPAIFQPLWFYSQGLIGKAEAEGAGVEMIHPEATIFSLDWVHFQVTPNKLSLKLLQAGFEEPLKDLTVSLCKLLPHTPAKFIGLNYDDVFALGSDEEWHAFGHSLVPKEQLWNNVLEQPGTASVTVRGSRDGDPEKKSGVISVRIEPDRSVKYGVSVHINDHYVLPQSEAGQSSFRDVLECIQNVWDQSNAAAASTFKKVREYATSSNR